MTTTVIVRTGEDAAAVLSYPRDADPVFGADFTEVASLPPHFEQAFTVTEGIDLLVVQLPVDGAAVAVPETSPAMTREAA